MNVLKSQKEKSKSTAHKVLEVESLGVNIKDFTTAEKLIKWLEDLKTKENKFPRAWLKKRLLQENEDFWKAFTELLKSNRKHSKLRLPLSIKALKQWKQEKEQIAVKKIKSAKKANKQFLYEPNNHRLWYNYEEVLAKSMTQWGRMRFIVEDNKENNSYLYLEPTLEKDWLLKVYCQEKRDNQLRHFRTYCSYRDTRLVSINLHEWDEITKNEAGKWTKKFSHEENFFLGSNSPTFANSQVKIE